MDWRRVGKCGRVKRKEGWDWGVSGGGEGQKEGQPSERSWIEGQ